MTKKFIEKVFRYGMVFTRKYDYGTAIEDRFEDDRFVRYLIIKRIPAKLSGTVEAINGWEEVYRERVAESEVIV